MRLGILLIALGAVLVGGYGFYLLGRGLALGLGIPLVLRIGLPLIGLGAFVALGAALWDRLRSGPPGSDDIEGAQP